MGFFPIPEAALTAFQSTSPFVIKHSNDQVLLCSWKFAHGIQKVSFCLIFDAKIRLLSAIETQKRRAGETEIALVGRSTSS